MKKRLHTQVGESQVSDASGLIDSTGCVFAYGTVLAYSLDIQKTSVGLEADFPRCG